MLLQNFTNNIFLNITKFNIINFKSFTLRIQYEYCILVLQNNSLHFKLNCFVKLI